MLVSTLILLIFWTESQLVAGYASGMTSSSWPTVLSDLLAGEDLS
ncbi:MAG: hypothetical protein RLZ96_17, partial [Actinomycetota bacterium]